MTRTPLACGAISLGLIPVNFIVWFMAVDGQKQHESFFFTVFSLVAVVQFVLGIVGLVGGIRGRREGGIPTAVIGGIAALGAPLGWVLGAAVMAMGSIGGAWGRPLRVRGRLLHPSLREGSDWTRGDRPDASRLDEPTRRALEALWLHDAQKEHASVPAFSRISWLLAAVGAPAELMEWSHRAALEEIQHTRLCFALAAGYAGRSHTVEPMPDLLIGALELDGDPILTLATESLTDGCQLEDFNADVAAACAEACEEPATRSVLLQIAREERSHADFSWALLEWLIDRDRSVVPALERELAELDRVRRPTAVSWDKRALVARASADQLRTHGRLPDERWAELWKTRLVETSQRARNLIAQKIGRRIA